MPELRAIAVLVAVAGLLVAMPAFAGATRRGAITPIALGAGGATALSIIVLALVEQRVLAPLGLGYLRTFALVMVVATAVLATHILTRWWIGRRRVGVASPSRVGVASASRDGVPARDAPDGVPARGGGLSRDSETTLVLAAGTCSMAAVVLMDIGSMWLRTSLVSGLVSGIAITVSLVLFAALRERSDAADVPIALRGTPIALITAALAGLAVLGLVGPGGG